MSEPASIQLLLVDDLPDQVKLAAEMLEREDNRFSVETATSTSDGLNRVTANDFDCIVSDYKLSGENGIEFLNAIRDEYSDLPFILLTGEGSEEVVSEAISAGMTDYLQKGSTNHYTVLANRVSNAVEQYRSRLQLEETEGHLSKIAEATNDILYVFNGNWSELLFVNSAYETVFGGSVSELKANPQSFLSTVHPADREKVRESMERVSNGEREVLEYRIQTEDEDVRWIRGDSKPSFDNKGNVTQIVGSTSDITENKKRAQNLERANELFNEAETLGAIGAWEIDTDGTLVWTDGTRRIHEVDADFTPTIEDGIEFYHPADREEIEQALDAALEDGESYDRELRIITAQGNQRWIRTRGKAIGEDKPRIVRGFIVDITETKKRERELLRRTKAIEDAPIGISISDPDQEDNPLIYINKAFEELTGYPRKDVLGANCRLLQGEDTDSDQVARIRDAIDAEEPISIELRNYRKDGSEFWNNLKIAPVRDDTGEVVNYIGFHQDITGRKERERQISILDRVLRHNMRNDMNVIRGWAETIHSTSSGEGEAAADVIINKSDDLIDLADKERQIMRLLQDEPAQRQIDISDSLTVIASRLESRYPEATIAIDCAEDVTVQATSNFRRVISELMTNAIVHNDSSSPEVTGNVTQTDETVRIEVSDTGPDIPEVERGLLAAKVEPTPVEHGRGLGLWLVKLIVTRSGGTITIEENSPVGNSVIIDLPR